MPKKEGNKRLMVCGCGFKSKDIDDATLSEKGSDTKKEVSVIERSDTDSLPLTDADCPKCGNDRAHYWLVQTRASDEPETKFLRCNKCKHTWRDYN